MITDSQIMELFTCISKLKEDEVLNKAQLSRQTGISRKSIDRFIEQLKLKGYKPADVLKFSEHKLSSIVRDLGHRKDFKVPEWQAFYDFLHPARVYKHKPKIEQAWLELYVKNNFDVDEEFLPASRAIMM